MTGLLSFFSDDPLVMAGGLVVCGGWRVACGRSPEALEQPHWAAMRRPVQQLWEGAKKRYF